MMLRKAYVYMLLKWRGHRLPSLAELEIQFGLKPGGIRRLSEPAA